MNLNLNLIKKLRVAKKYQDAISDLYMEDGEYWCELKEGFEFSILDNSIASESRIEEMRTLIRSIVYVGVDEEDTVDEEDVVDEVNQLKEEIEALKNELEQHKNSYVELEKMYLKQKGENKELKKEIQSLKETIVELKEDAKTNKPVHNERNAGRKKSISDEEEGLIVMWRNQGETYRTIVDRFRETFNKPLSLCSVNRILKQYELK